VGSVACKERIIVSLSRCPNNKTAALFLRTISEFGSLFLLIVNVLFTFHSIPSLLLSLTEEKSTLLVRMFHVCHS